MRAAGHLYDVRGGWRVRVRLWIPKGREDVEVIGRVGNCIQALPTFNESALPASYYAHEPAGPLELDSLELLGAPIEWDTAQPNVQLALEFRNNSRDVVPVLAVMLCAVAHRSAPEWADLGVSRSGASELAAALARLLSTPELEQLGEPFEQLVIRAEDALTIRGDAVRSRINGSLERGTLDVVRCPKCARVDGDATGVVVRDRARAQVTCRKCGIAYHAELEPQPPVIVSRC